MFFDLAALRRMLPVLTFAEFQEKHGAAKGLDLATATSFANVPDRVAWKKWLTEHASVHRNGETKTGGVGMGACQVSGPPRMSRVLWLLAAGGDGGRGSESSFGDIADTVCVGGGVKWRDRGDRGDGLESVRVRW